MMASPVWHPFTQHGLAPAITEVSSAEGAYLVASDGRRIFDAISSWWVITHGHRHPAIVRAIRAQAEQLDQVIFAGYTHAPAETLAAGLVALTPPGLDHVFYSDSGSTSVEVALKMALGFWRHSGEARSRIIVMEGSYHGDTVGTMSVGARGVFNQAYAPLLFDVDRIPFPMSGREEETLRGLDAFCANGAAALIVEPLVLGAGGMLMYPAAMLAAMQTVCARHGVLFIADEVMTGWGRTGTLLACEQAGAVPDIVCLSKGLSGGALPLAVTMCSRAIYRAHYSTDRSRTLFHSSSYTANPIACAAAVANLAVWREEPVAERVAALAARQSAALARFRDDRRFTSVRQTGTITAFDLVVQDAGYLAGIGPALLDFFRESGVLLRPLGNTIYVLPPYCSTQDDLDATYDAIAAAAERFA
jgi:adenosylmethionine---8-amino-7-oxononanoate aminotransferase